MHSGKKLDKEKFIRLSISQISKLLKQDNASELKLALRILKEAPLLSEKESIELDLLLKSKEETLIPISVFRDRNLSSLQILVRYLKENLGFSFKDISKLTNRDQRTIWTTYTVARRKYSEKIEVKDLEISIPVILFSNRNLSTLEVIVNFLHSNLSFKISKISRLLNRDSRTIWTVVNRIKEKNVKKQA